MAGIKRVSGMKARITPTFSRNKFKDGKNHASKIIGGRGRSVSIPRASSKSNTK